MEGERTSALAAARKVTCVYCELFFLLGKRGQVYAAIFNSGIRIFLCTEDSEGFVSKLHVSFAGLLKCTQSFTKYIKTEQKNKGRKNI